MMRIAPLLLSGLALACGAQALAHAHFSPSTVAPGYAGPMAIHIGHGCDGQATERLTLYVPEQVTVTPMAKLNWQVSSSEVRGRVTQIVWSGSHLPNDQKDEFAFHLVAPKSIGAVAMAVKQECANGELFWQETAAKSRFPVARFQVSADAMAGVADAHDHDHDHHHDHDHEHHDHDHHDHDHHAH